MNFFRHFFQKKSFESVKEVSANNSLSKTLGATDLVLLGLGAIVGSGVFVLTGMVAAQYSGPAVTLSYAIAGLVCIFVALSYTELATMLPTSGSVYTYTQVAFGELCAWLIGGVMILEFGFGSATVAASWSGYAQGILASAGIHLPDYLTKVPSEGGLINLPAFLIVLVIGYILYLGTKDSKKLNNILVLIKMLAIVAFIISAFGHVKVENWENYMPFGFNNVLVGSSILFFSFTGFGTIATAAEECKNPKRDLMIGIVGSLAVSTVIYVIAAALMTGIAPYHTLNNAQPMAHALRFNGNSIGSAIVATGAICGMTTVLMMQIYGQSRIFYVIARDGLLPKTFAKMHHKYNSPYVNLMFFAVSISLLAAFSPCQVLGQLSSMGALIDYIVMCLIVMVFRYKFPSAQRTFKCPFVFVIAPVAVISCIYLLSKQIIDDNNNLLLTGKLLIGWLIAIFMLYIMRLAILAANKSKTVKSS